MNPSTPTQTADLLEDPSTPLEELLGAPVALARHTTVNEINGARIGTVVGFTDDGSLALVRYPDQLETAALPAPAVIDMDAADIGRRVVLMFENSDPFRPLILGCLRERGVRAVSKTLREVEVDADGERVVIGAKQQIVLRCGKASITLTRDGKILLQGAYVSNRSSGVMRIKGGTVQIN